MLDLQLLLVFSVQSFQFFDLEGFEIDLLRKFVGHVVVLDTLVFLLLVYEFAVHLHFALHLADVLFLIGELVFKFDDLVDVVVVF